MWVSRVTLDNVRSFSNEAVDLSKGLNVFIGRNNAGKSTILHAVRQLQDKSSLDATDRRVGTEIGKITLDVNGARHGQLESPAKYSVQLDGNRQLRLIDGGERGVTRLPAREFDNFIYPYLSKRKVQGYDETVNTNTTTAVSGTLHNLYAKIDRISNPARPAYERYAQVCDEILGFLVTTTSSGEGKKAALVIDNQHEILVDRMGEGVANLLGLIVDLCIAEDRLFVIEEPENDIHPAALKTLLSLISEKAASNQFIISTHSHIVAKYLGAESDAKLFNVGITGFEGVPTSNVQELTTGEARREALESLGYELADFDLWNGWLILEESSAESVIRDHLTRWFTPKLQGRLRTLSAGGKDRVKVRFDDFNRLFAFLHLDHAYKNKAWVIIDGGEREKVIIDDLKNTYAHGDWDEEHFQQFSQENFEKYYPAEFQERATQILDLVDKQAKREAKTELLTDVLAWIASDDDRAKEQFGTSAAEVIEKLQSIEKALDGHG